MTVLANPQDLDIQSARIFNLLLVFPAVFLYFVLVYHAVRQVIIIGVYVSMLKQIFPHEVVIALQRIFIHRVILVKIKSDHIFKA